MKETPISSTLLSRLTDATRYVISGAAPAAWFGPMRPQKPQAPDDVAGRRFDYPVGYNLSASTRTSEPVTFDDLRALADSCDILRSVIETRKDQMEALEWCIRVKPSILGAHGKPSDEQKQTINDVIKFLQYPDGQHSFAQWLRQVLEDMFVIDAVAIYKRRNRMGSISALEIMDGASISLLLGDDGRTPHAPEPAYQQILKGIPAVDYTREELLYIQHNPRSHKVYGYSHVEQVLVTVNILIRRALHQLEYYREGSQPDALIGLPKEWSQDQINCFQKHFDSFLAGNSAMRHRVRFMPGDFKYQETKAPPLKDAYDEFLARIICFVFSVSPEPFVGQVNRATAESSYARAIAEGLAPLQGFVRELMNRIVQRELGYAELEFVWQDTRGQDPREVAQIDVAYVGAGILTADEVRARMGLAALAEKPVVEKYNHNHDERGRFTFGTGAVEPEEKEVASIKPPSVVSGHGSEVAANPASLVTPLAVGLPIVAGAILGYQNKDTLKPVHFNDAAPTDEEKKPASETKENTDKEKTEKPDSLPKPEGIPDNWIEKPTLDGTGRIWVNPENKNDIIRVMPAKPESEYPSQHLPYVIDQKGGYRDVNGNPIPGEKPGKTPEAHIPLSEFKYKR